MMDTNNLKLTEEEIREIVKIELEHGTLLTENIWKTTIQKALQLLGIAAAKWASGMVWKQAANLVKTSTMKFYRTRLVRNTLVKWEKVATHGATQTGSPAMRPASITKALDGYPPGLPNTDAEFLAAADWVAKKTILKWSTGSHSVYAKAVQIAVTGTLGTLLWSGMVKEALSALRWGKDDADLLANNYPHMRLAIDPRYAKMIDTVGRELFKDAGGIVSIGPPTPGNELAGSEGEKVSHAGMSSDDWLTLLRGLAFASEWADFEGGGSESEFNPSQIFDIDELSMQSMIAFVEALEGDPTMCVYMMSQMSGAIPQDQLDRIKLVLIERINETSESWFSVGGLTNWVQQFWPDMPAVTPNWWAAQEKFLKVIESIPFYFVNAAGSTTAVMTSAVDSDEGGIGPILDANEEAIMVAINNAYPEEWNQLKSENDKDAGGGDSDKDDEPTVADPKIDPFLLSIAGTLGVQIEGKQDPETYLSELFESKASCSICVYHKNLLGLTAAIWPNGTSADADPAAMDTFGRSLTRMFPAGLGRGKLPAGSQKGGIIAQAVWSEASDPAIMTSLTSCIKYASEAIGAVGESPRGSSITALMNTWNAELATKQGAGGKLNQRDTAVIDFYNNLKKCYVGDSGAASSCGCTPVKAQEWI